MKKLSAFLILISFAVAFIFSCQKDASDATYLAGESNNLRTTVTGIVLDESNAALSGVTVTAYGQTTTTNQYGTFVLKNLNAKNDRCVLEFSKTGFFNRTHGFIASANTVNYVRIILINNTSSQNFSSSTGGTVSLTDGSSAEFQPNSFVTSNGSAYTGTVNLIVKHLSPDDANFGFMIPGGDLLGKNLNDEDVALYTYGMLGIELLGSGEALQLAAGSSATLTFSIAASQLSSAPASIPLWYFDETTSLWKEEGTANKVGNNYVGTVVHFSWWNCDFSGPRAFIHGRVVNNNGIPVANVIVSNTMGGHGITDQNGEYQGGILSGIASSLQAIFSFNSGSLYSQTENIPALATNQTFTVPDLILNGITSVSGILKNCDGVNTDGYIFLSNNTFTSIQYAAFGSFNIPASENMQCNLMVISGVYYHTQSITTLNSSTNLNLGDILMCDTIGYLIASATIFHENFENPDSVISYSSNITANAGWNLNSRLATSGIFSDSSYVTVGDTTILTTVPFSTIGYDTIILSFNHICKIDFFNKATVEISADNGATWYQLSSAEYTGSGPFGLQGNGFSSASYGIWVPGVPTVVPTNSWWKAETFNLSNVLSGAPIARIRFVLSDPTSQGGNGCAGWFIDDIRIGGS